MPSSYPDLVLLYRKDSPWDFSGISCSKVRFLSKGTNLPHWRRALARSRMIAGRRKHCSIGYSSCWKSALAKTSTVTDASADTSSSVHKWRLASIPSGASFSGAAQVLGVTRARMKQVVSLLGLSADVQEELFTGEGIDKNRADVHLGGKRFQSEVGSIPARESRLKDPSPIHAPWRSCEVARRRDAVGSSVHLYCLVIS